MDEMAPPKIEIVTVAEAEKANAALFVKPSSITRREGYQRPLLPTKSQCTAKEVAPKKGRFSASTICALNASMERGEMKSQSARCSFSERIKNAVKPSERMQGDHSTSSSMNWRSGPRRTANVLPTERSFSWRRGGNGPVYTPPFRRPSPMKLAQSELSKESGVSVNEGSKGAVNGDEVDVAYDSQSTTSTETVNVNGSERECAPKRRRKRRRNRRKNKKMGGSE